ncbi:LuxR C-terminal-related transcriptional regulator [Bradyrhizobium sp.]|uniref:LuxR C-terminal-related transcriptional regulator n=1 Tax=Bradyrhizobium sp. TaxID=376 RepID=UPI0040383A52
MSSDPGVPTYILQRDGLFREGLRLILSETRFCPQGCAIELDDLGEVPCDRAVLFIVGLDANDAMICSRIREQYPLAFVVAVGDESSPESLANALDDGASAALFSSVSPDALLSTLQAVINERLVLIDARLWSLEIQPKAEERLTPSLQDEIPWMSADQAARQLSSREIAILERIVRGDSNKHVARFFNIAEPTVKAHVKAILRKIGASNRTQAAIWAVNRRLFDNTDGVSNLPILLDSSSDH